MIYSLNIPRPVSSVNQREYAVVKVDEVLLGDWTSFDLAPED